jgi:multimeric flavodoxin WrbA
MTLHALAFNCTLKRSPEPTSSQLMLEQLASELRRHDVETEIVRGVDFDIRPGVRADEGDGDQWPELRAKLLRADIVVMGTPIWLGAPSSVCKRIVERLDAMLGEGDDRARLPTFGKVAVVAVVGNEDGAHHVAAECYQWLSDVGFSIPPSGAVYWVGEAMGSVDYKDLDATPAKVTATLRSLAANAAHLARVLAAQPYPGVEDRG